MSTKDQGSQELVCWARARDLGLRLHPVSGLPLALVVHREDQTFELPLALRAALHVDGEERQGMPYGLEYIDTTTLDACRLLDLRPEQQLAGSEVCYVVHTALGPWMVDWEYRFRQQHPRLELSLSLRPSAEAGSATLRDLVLSFELALPDLGDWQIEAPGNPFRPGLPADSLREPLPVSPAGGVMGSTGLIAAHHPEQGLTLVLWPFSRTEIGAIRLQTEGSGLRCEVKTGLAGRMTQGTTLRYGAIQLDLLAEPWENVRAHVPAWYVTLGLSTPHDRPDWIRAASIFEVQIGESVFWQGYRYGPYPSVRDLIADLERIKDLGYDVLQIMPRQPYPSYNVHSYADITTSYGDEDDLRSLVAMCHERGMRVILDILLHGVIDQEVMAATAARVRSGPYYARLAETGDTFHGTAQAVRDVYHIAWSRHILDFEQHWAGGSPPRHPLADEHPEWFLRDSAQQIIGIYTKAFDVANPAWQAYFSQACEELMRRLDIDGFRFDAPTYNDLPNWSKATEQRASYSPLGCLELFDSLRVRLKRLKPDAILYTEPSGVLFRRAMDFTYNYDEQWLIASVMRPESGDQGRAVRNGRDLATWFRDRNAVLPMGSLITHHIDSHDTFWWPLPGAKWRREQFGLAATRALLAVFALSGGAYMTFVGGEQGLEDDIRRIHQLRATIPALGRGLADYEAVAVADTAIYGVMRREAGSVALVLVNLSDAAITTTCVFSSERALTARKARAVHDLWNDELLFFDELSHSQGGMGQHQLQLRFAPYQLRILMQGD